MTDHTPMPNERLVALADAYLAGELTPDELAELERELKESSASRALFALVTDQAATMHEVFSSKETAELQVETSEALSFIDALQALDDNNHTASIVDLTDELQQRKLRQLERERARAYRPAREEPSRQRMIIIPKAVVWLGLAAVLLLGAILISMYTRSPATPPDLIVDQPGHRDAPVVPDPVGTLTYTENAVWSGPGARRLAVNSRVTPGPLSLESGIAHVVMDSGAVVMLRGPVEVDLTAAWVTELSHGSVVVRVPEAAHGFKVVGDGFVVTDLGTEFAVRVGEDGVQCRVVLGEVALAATGPDAVDTSAHRLLGNHIVEINPINGAIHEMDFADADDIAWALPYTALLNRELVVNGGFEDGPIGIAHTFSRVDNVAIPGWDNDGEATVIGYEQAGVQVDIGFPDPRADLVPEERGQAYFFARYSETVTQTIDLSELALLADAGDARFVFGGDLGGYVTQDDRVLVSVTFFDAAGQVLSRAELDPVDAQARKDRTGFIRRTHTDVLPAGTRSARIEISSVLDVGGFLDGFADNISLWVEVVTPENTNSTAGWCNVTSVNCSLCGASC